MSELITSPYAIKRLWDEMQALKARVNRISTAAGQLRFDGDTFVGVLPEHPLVSSRHSGESDYTSTLRLLGLYIGDANFRWYLSTNIYGYFDENDYIVYFRGTNTLEVRINSSRRLRIAEAGQLDLPQIGGTGGLLLGGDAQWYRSAADMLRTPDSVTIDQILHLAQYAELAEIAKPGNPADGFGRFYMKSDDKIYFLNTGGTEFDLTASGGDASTVTFTPAVATDWDGDADPGNLDDAVDQLAKRVDDLEALAHTIPFIIDGGGSAITTGVKGYVTVDFPCTITMWTMVSDAVPTATDLVVEIKKSSYAGFHASLASITGTENPQITVAGAVRKGQGSSLTGWTTAIAAGDILEFSVETAPGTTTLAMLGLKVMRT